MATIGTFTKLENTYQGSISTLTLKSKLTISPVDKTSDKAPDFRVYAGNVEIGAAWTTTSGQGNEYLAVKLDDPSFTAAIYCRLVTSGEDHLLVWTR